MPITVQCRSCAARYNVVDSAAGRRVKCRRCGGSFNVPGGAEEGVAPPLDLRAMAELERTGQLVATSAESEYEQYKTAVAERDKPATAVVKKDYRSIHDLATPDAKKKFALETSGKGAANQAGSIAAMLVTALGGLVFAAGVILWTGNVYGYMRTFPGAGYLTLTLGGAMIGAGRKM